MISASFGRTCDGSEARIFSLRNASGFRAEITDFGAALVRLMAPDRHGRLGDVVLGFDRVSDYAGHPFFLGATVGRYANRIAGGRFALDGVTHQLSLNNGAADARCHLHGGPGGFQHRLWVAETREDPRGVSLRLTCRSPDGEEGYPGSLDTTVAYTVPADRNELRLDYEARTDRATPVNLTHHSYFNLGGETARDVLDHRLQIAAGRFTPINAALIPRGPHLPVAETPFDFRAPRSIGEGIAADDEQLRLAGGYDHNYALDAGGGGLALAATVLEPDSGRVMEVLTTEPGLQLYSGNFLDGSWPGKGGRIHAKHAGFCLETQHFPDSPNQPTFPSTILRPGQVFRSTTIYRFGTAAV
ncbi:MAG: Aldose 1-epimerase precursor [Verrucomicrobiota bacterium]|jgi:aldose 1-epimerase